VRVHVPPTGGVLADHVIRTVTRAAKLLLEQQTPVNTLHNVSPSSCFCTRSRQVLYLTPTQVKTHRATPWGTKMHWLHQVKPSAASDTNAGQDTLDNTIADQDALVTPDEAK
jgi:hypothetical protein